MFAIAIDDDENDDDDEHTARRRDQPGSQSAKATKVVGTRTRIGAIDNDNDTAEGSLYACVCVS